MLGCAWDRVGNREKGPSSVSMSLLRCLPPSLLSDTGKWEIIEPLAEEKNQIKMTQGQNRTCACRAMEGATKAPANKTDRPRAARLIPCLQRTPCHGDTS